MTALAEEGMTLKKTACMNYIKQALEAGGGKPPTPQKPGGVYVPFKYEQRLAEVVKVLRDKKFPVFPDLVCHWCTQMVAGTEYASYFPEGKATIGWYRGWLRRTPCLTGHQRPLEMTMHQWLTEGNLEQYFEICANVLVKAGVAERNPAFDPNKNPAFDPNKRRRSSELFSSATHRETSRKALRRNFWTELGRWKRLRKPWRVSKPITRQHKLRLKSLRLHRRLFPCLRLFPSNSTLLELPLGVLFHILSLKFAYILF